MSTDKETKQQELARLQGELKELKRTFPEHCYGTKGYIGVHRATPEHFQKMEDLEERIKQLEGELEA